MVKVICFVELGQSNAEGFADQRDLPTIGRSDLKGPQTDIWIFNRQGGPNYDGTTPAIEVQQVDEMAGPNVSPSLAAIIASRGGQDNVSVTEYLLNSAGPPFSDQAYPNTGSLYPKINHGLGPIASRSKKLQEYLGVPIYNFKFTIPNTCLGPAIFTRSWGVESDDIYNELFVQTINGSSGGLFKQFLIAMDNAGFEPDIQGIFWTQGEGDYLVEGNDGAYLSLFKRFKKEVRKNFEPYTSLPVIPWISSLCFFTSLLGTYERQNNVRAALRRAGWDDPAYRVVDFQNYSFGPDFFHLDTAGVVAYGEDQFDAWINIDKNNSMAFEEYNLSSLRDRLFEEFGIEEDPADRNKAIVDKRINDAISWVVNRRKNWPWMYRQSVIEIGEWTDNLQVDRYGAAIFERGQDSSSNMVSFDPANPLALTSVTDPVLPREFITIPGVDRPVMVEGVVGSGMNMEDRFTGDSWILALSNVTHTISETTLTVNSLESTTGETAVLPKNITTFPVRIRGVTGADAAAISEIVPFPGRVFFCERVDDNTMKTSKISLASGDVTTINATDIVVTDNANLVPPTAEWTTTSFLNGRTLRVGSSTAVITSNSTSAPWTIFFTGGWIGGTPSGFVFAVDPIITMPSGTIQIGHEFKISQGLFQLPEDFVRMATVHIDSVDDPLKYVEPADFERIRLSKEVRNTRNPIYTVVVDPLNEDVDRKYVWVYPYYEGQDKMRVKYYGDPKKLVSELDVPDVPKSDRFVVWYASCWFVAQWLKDNELVAFYRDGAMNELERMAKEYNLSDDTSSEIEFDDFGDVDGPRPPGGYPEFDL